MPETPRSDPIDARLRGVLTLTRFGLLAERIARAFWPLWAVTLVTAAALLMGFHEIAPIEFVWLGMLAAPLAALVATVYGIRWFRWPRLGDAKARLDETLPGRPVAALEDSQAIGATDAASRAVWDAHRARMSARLATARPVRPTLSLVRFDPFGLRYIALVLFSLGLLFGSIWRVESIAGMAPGQADALAIGPAWEGWIEPPLYTGQPSLYLADLSGDDIEVPKGSRVMARLYGEVGALTLTETVSGRLEDTGSVSDPVQEFDIVQEGEIAINGTGGQVWQVVMAPDLMPNVSIDGPITSEASGEMSLPFSASDDFGVRSGQAVVQLDLASVDRRYGRAMDPEPRDTLLIDMPMPISGDRRVFSEILVENMSEHPWANLPVKLHLKVEDAIGQTAQSVELETVLPGRRFFVPLAKAIIEQRQALLWNRENGTEVAQVLRAVSHLPEGLFRAETDYLRLRHLVRQLEVAISYGPGLSLENRDEIAKDLWDLSLRIEDGNLSDAMERLRRAQERLAEAIRDGASDEEIADLMQELREAMQEYMRQLAEQMQENGDQQSAQNQQSQEITGDQLQQMLERLQQLMEEGRMAEAAQLLEQLRQMMENMQMAQGQPGGQGGGAGQAMQGLQETLRNQQGLSDESFSDLQDQFNEGGQQEGQGQGEQPGQGQSGEGQPGQGQPGQGQSGQGQSGQGGTQGLGLAERQQALRETLRQQQQSLPGNEATNEALDRAGRAMEGAEEALRNDDIAGALDQQSEAMDALRDGMAALGEQMAEQQPGDGEGGPGDGQGQAAEGQGRDPLGRQSGDNTSPDQRGGMLPGESPAGRAQDLQDEIRRRSTEQQRPEDERDYLNRLLDRF